MGDDPGLSGLVLSEVHCGGRRRLRREREGDMRTERQLK
jgi:hypothetical protein